MSIWLIGNRGMLGTEVEALLEQEKYSHISTDVEVDITDKEELLSLIRNKREKIEWIINCSGYTAVDKAEDEPDLAYKINAEGVSNIAEIACSLKANLIHISTDYVFNGEKPKAYLEDDPPDPQGLYGKSKLQGENNIRNALSKYYILRTAWLYGKNGRNFVTTMIKLFQERDTIEVVSDQWGSPTYAKDLAGMILRIIWQDNGSYGVYQYTNEGRISWYEFAREIHKKACEKGLCTADVQLLLITTDQYPTKAKRPHDSYMSKEKIKETFNVSIRRWKEALEEFIDELKG